MRLYSITPAADRFWSKVQKTAGCWLWTGGTFPAGHGAFNVSPRAHKVTGAHRFSYELHYGSIPESMSVCHTCDTPACVRPDHLFLGTQTDNIADMNSKGRGNSYGAKTREMRGEANNSAKLTEAQVREIRLRFHTISRRKLAAEFGVSRRCLKFIEDGRHWSHLT